MSEALNEIHAYFGKLNTTTTAPVKQWAYGQKLVIHDADLPNVFEAYYSNSRSRGEASPQIGTDGVVDAPHAYFRSGADIYVFLMVHEGQDDGRYNKIVHIPIDPCAEPSDVEPEPYEQNVIDQAIAALDDAVEQTGEDKAATAALAEAAAASSLIATGAAQSAQGSATSASASATTASTAAETATQKASEAATSAANAASAKTAAETAETNAEAARTASESAQASAESAAQTATAKASEASTSAISASGSASAASASASAASESATQASQSATAASGSATSAATSVSTASIKASEASASATAAQTAQTAAEAAQTAAETAAATFETDTTLTVSGKAADAKAVGDELFVDTSVEIVVTPDSTSANFKLIGDGNCVSNSSYNIYKYAVTAGETYKVVSNDYFQFQKAPGVPTSNNRNVVGEIYGVGTFNVTVPETATYLISSALKTDTESGVFSVTVGEKISKIGALTDRLDAIDTASVADAGKALKVKTVTDGHVSEWEFGSESTGSDSLDTYVKNNMVTIPNMFSDPLFEDTENANIYTFNRIVSHATENARLVCVSGTLNNQYIQINCNASESTDILYYNVKLNVVGITGSTLTVLIIGKSHTITEDGTYTVSGYSTGGATRFLRLTYGGAGTRTTIIYCPIAVNLTEMFGTDAIPSITDFENVFTNFDRDLFGKWISKEKYDYIKNNATKYSARNFAVPSLFDSQGNKITKFTDDETTKTGTGSSAEINSDIVSIYGNGDVGDVIYFALSVKVSDSVCEEITIINGDKTYQTIDTPTADTWYRLSGIGTAYNLGTTGRYINAKSVYADSATQNGKTLTYKYGMAINLTRVFGAGHEPMDASIVDAMLTKYSNQWYAGTNDIWNDSYAVGMLGKMREFSGGEMYGVKDGRFVAGSVVNSALADWAFDQYSYGLNKFVVPVNNKFEGGIETNGMVQVFPKYGRWEKGAADQTGESGSIFGGHVFEAWNNIGSYRLTMMMAHGGDEREDEACIITYCPGTFDSPLVPLTPEQEANRITRERADAYGGGTMNFMQGRIRIGSDRAGEGTVFRAKSTKFYGSVCLNGSRGSVVGATNEGTKGDICFDDNYLYICVDTNTWKRIPLSW